MGRQNEITGFINHVSLMCALSGRGKTGEVLKVMIEGVAAEEDGHIALKVELEVADVR